MIDYFASFQPDLHGVPLPDVEVRPAADADLAACGHLVARREGGDAGAWTERLRICRTEGDQQVFVAACGDRIVGYAKVGWLEPVAAGGRGAPDGWYLSGIVVAPEFRRRGLGRLLTEARCAWVFERADAVYYVASATNRASVVLHEDLGFREITRDFVLPGVTFGRSDGVLFRAESFASRVRRLEPSRSA